MRLVACLGLLVLLGCDSKPAQLDPNPAKARLHELVFARRDGDLEMVGSLVLPTRRTGLMNTVVAMDRYTESAETFEAELRERFGAQFIRGITLTNFGRNQAVLSEQVELLDAIAAPDEEGVVQVAYVVNDTPPARYARMVQHEGQWYYDPGAGFTAEFPQAFNRMADELQTQLEILRTDAESSARIAADPQAFLDQLADKLTEGLKLLPR